jgi:hypothetical protein
VTVARTEAPIGSPLEMTYRFVVAPDAPAFAEDYWVFVHFIDTDEELMWTDDHPPDLPTTQWKPGQTVEYTRTMFIPKFPYVGQTKVEVGLFSPKTGERLPLSGETHGQRAYRVATFDLRLQSDNLIVVFRNGWHPTEVGDEGTGVEWQWSRKTATLTFRNPKRDATLYVMLDQPVAALSGPQQVEFRIGDTVVDAFALRQGPPELRKIELGAAQLGEDENVDLSITVDRTSAAPIRANWVSGCSAPSFSRNSR